MLKLFRWTNFFVLLLWLLSLILSTNGEIYYKKGSPHVRIGNNRLIVGKTHFSRGGQPYISFVGIPYATVSKRFAEGKLLPEPSWESGTKVKAVKPGKVCPQSKGPLLGKDSVIGEDCLNLNVYIPMSDPSDVGQKFPVMVWIYGGGFRSGEGYVHGPQFFMDEDVILVTFNYRLGVFGFLSTEDEVVPGNNGMKDCVLLLQWIQMNIKQFGGNPGNVTIFGHSAGGAAVHYLLSSSTTKGLFHRALSQSGSAFHEWGYKTNTRKTAVELATHMKCPKLPENPSEISSEEILTCFRKASMNELISAQTSFKSSWPLNMADFFFGPTKEVNPTNMSSSSTVTPFLTESPYEVMADATKPFHSVPWILGITEDEGAPMYAAVVVKSPKLLHDLNTNWKEIAPSTFMFSTLPNKTEQEGIAQKLKSFYFENKSITAEKRHNLSNIYTDMLFGYGVYKAALTAAARGKGNPVYLYQYAYSKGAARKCIYAQCNEVERKKVGHGDELSMLFDIDGTLIPKGVPGLPERGSPQEIFSKNFVKLWTSFAIHGEPRHTWGNSSNGEWKPISENEVKGQAPLMWYRIDDNPGQVESPYGDRLTFIDKMYSEKHIPISTSDESQNRVEL